MKKNGNYNNKDVQHLGDVGYLSRIVLAIVLFLFAGTAHSQSLSLFEVDASNFPTIKAKFFALDKDGNQITNLSPSSFELKENGQERTVTSISCPSPQPPKALSSVLVMDASGSMTGRNLELAKIAAKAWIDALPLGKSECAITAFDTKNYIIQDFTIDKSKLLKGANSLFASGGTNYDAAMINPFAGGLQVTQQSRNKRVIVFLTDGMPNLEPKTTQIIMESKNQNVIVYAVTLGMKCPQSLKNISNQTGGQWFENVTTLEQARQIYHQILQTAQGGNPCSIEWQSDVSCKDGITQVDLTLLLNGTNAKSSYQSTNNSVAKLEFVPTILKFNDPQVGVKVEQKAIVTARNSNFKVINISSNNAGFDITPKSFELNFGQSIELTITYLPADSSYNFCRFEVINDICPAEFYVNGGWSISSKINQTIKLIHPNGGEVFVAGIDTIITWEGVSPEEPVRLEYRIADNQPWITIADSVVGLNYKWVVPPTPSNQCLARVTSGIKEFGFEKNMILIPSGNFQMGNSTNTSDFDNEKPVRNITISYDFLMCKTEITQKQFFDVMGNNPSNWYGENLPVEQVSWIDAIEFCNKLSEIEGYDKCYSFNGSAIVCDWNANGYRLPTEAEWEYACRSGTTTDYYSGNMSYKDCEPLDPNLDEIGWYCGNANNKTKEVGKKTPNNFGLYDMIGNVWEWCWDWYDKYSTGISKDPKGAPSGIYRVFRGGGWNDYASDSRSAYRFFDYPEFKRTSVGFRIVTRRTK